MTELDSKIEGSYPIVKHHLDAPTLAELAAILEPGLQKSFKTASVSVTACPNLYDEPFYLAAPGLCGSERIADVGGLIHLHPVPNFDKKYSLISIMNQMELPQNQSFVLGAGAGPFHQIGHNSELIPNLSIGHNGTNRTQFAEIVNGGDYHSGPVPNGSTDCGLMANLFGSEGLPGPVLKITASHRTGPLNFTAAIQETLQSYYGERPVSLGGAFLIKKGKAKTHVMPDFCTERLEVGEAFDWLKFFEMDAPLVCPSVLHSYDPGWGLRMEHTHCFGLEKDGTKARGGHYHGDTTPETVEYEGYFNTAFSIYRIDQPPH